MTTTTTNYGWVKPDVGASDDVWGGYINTDLDGIDTIIKGVSVVANAAYPASNPSGYQTAGQVASVVIGDNRLINGDMRIDQRNNGALVTPANGDYSADRWRYGSTQASKLSSQRGAAAPGGGAAALGIAYYLSFTTASAYASVATDAFYAYQAVEADMVSDFAWGTSGAQPVTLSFLAYSSLTGTFSGAVSSYPGPSARSYPFTFLLPTVNTWTKIVVTIPGDTAGTWTMNGNNGALYVRFDLGCGANLRGSAGAWAGSNLVGVNGAVSLVGTAGAQFNITGVKLEIGSVATPFNRQSLAKSMADCQRYYCNLASIALSAGPPATAAGQQAYTFVTLPATMRAAPTVVGVPTVSSTNCSAAGSLNQFSTGFNLYITALAAGIFYATLGPITASAEL